VPECFFVAKKRKFLFFTNLNSPRACRSRCAWNQSVVAVRASLDCAEGPWCLWCLFGAEISASCGRVEGVESGEIGEIANIHAVFMHNVEKMIG
jgi:hypothetical protein